MTTHSVFFPEKKSVTPVPGAIWLYSGNICPRLRRKRVFPGRSMVKSTGNEGRSGLEKIDILKKRGVISFFLEKPN